MSDNLLTGTIEEIAEKARKILASYVSDAHCVPQEWDNRIDCIVRLPSGIVVGEMVLLNEATPSRIQEAGERLWKRRVGIPVALKNELWAPVRIA
jgi:hypothetical protein